MKAREPAQNEDYVLADLVQLQGRWCHISFNMAKVQMEEDFR